MVTTMVTKKSSLARVMPAGQFKAKCLELMDEVARTGEVITITKRGKPVARLAPIVDTTKPLFGFMEGKIKIVGDIVSPIDVEWDALK